MISTIKSLKSYKKFKILSPKYPNDMSKKGYFFRSLYTHRAHWGSRFKAIKESKEILKLEGNKECYWQSRVSRRARGFPLAPLAPSFHSKNHRTASFSDYIMSSENLENVFENFFIQQLQQQLTVL